MTLFPNTPQRFYHRDAGLSVVAGVSLSLAISRLMCFSHLISHLPLFRPVVGCGLLYLPAVGEVSLVSHQYERNIAVPLHS